MIDLTNKRAMVCGSTQGIGKASALLLAKQGASITLVARNEEALKQALKELPANANQKHDYIVADFNQPEELKKSVEKYLAGGAEFHILLNNSGGPPGGEIINAKVEDFTQTFQRHLVCNHILAQLLVPGMKKNKYGRIINIISTSVKEPIKGLGVSNTIRAAVANWSKTMAIELGPFGITVNNVLPGSTETVRIEEIIKNTSAKTGKSPEQVKTDMISKVPVGRFATAEEIAAAVAFLASPEAAYINGINLPVDGGRTGCL
jgi:3-oxoacyl-[acyl-carrier protein] reductase